MKWLADFGLRFPDEADEQQFFETFVLSKRIFVQYALLAGGLIVYVFFIWDEIIDYRHAPLTHLIRGLIGTPIIWASGLALYFRSLDRWFAYILLLPGLATSIVLGVIFSLLDGGFNFGAAGYLLLIIFVYCLIPLQSIHNVFFGIFIWIIFDIFELISSNANNGMFLVNNLLIGTAIVLTITSVIYREYSLRQQFQAKRDLVEAKTTVNELERFTTSLKRSAKRLIAVAETTVLISYRRADSEAITGRIRDRLASHFGDDAIFMDIDNIPLGLDFRQQIKLAARNAKIMLAIIGPDWHARSASGNYRISDEDDPVRIELETAFQERLAIIPVLVGRAIMPPPESLPPSISEFSYRNATEVDSGRDFHQHMDRLIRAMENIFKESNISNETRHPKELPAIT